VAPASLAACTPPLLKILDLSRVLPALLDSQHGGEALDMARVCVVAGRQLAARCGRAVSDASARRFARARCDDDDWVLEEEDPEVAAEDGELRACARRLQRLRAMETVLREALVAGIAGPPPESMDTRDSRDLATPAGTLLRSLRVVRKHLAHSEGVLAKRFEGVHDRRAARRCLVEALALRDTVAAMDPFHAAHAHAAVRHAFAILVDQVRTALFKDGHCCETSSRSRKH
jgi:hypothetical protein